MAIKDYDKILSRLMQILAKLSNGELPTMQELGEEFNVSLKTIQRDIYQRLMLFPIEKDPLGRLKFMEGFNLGKSRLSSDEIITMSLSLDMIKDAGSEFNESARHLFAKLLHPSFFNPYYIKPPQYESIDMDSPLMNRIESAIAGKEKSRMTYSGADVEVEPYKITNIEGIWYLLGCDPVQGKISTFLLSNISDFRSENVTFVPRHDIERLLPRIQSAFFDSGRSFEVEVKVHAKVADYFRLKDHLPSQKIVKEYDDGAVGISYMVTHEEDVDNLIKAWLPDIEVVKPAFFREKIGRELQEYIKRLGI